eukprot:548627_1
MDDVCKLLAPNKDEQDNINDDVGPSNIGVDCTKEDRLKISVIPPSLGLNRLPEVLCCVVDVSGSMGSEATLTESHGLTILDLVKHAIITIINCLNSNDYLSIVSYSSKALIQMTDKNKAKALNSLNNLNASGQTNLWDGFINSTKERNKYSNRRVFFTDKNRRRYYLYPPNV